MDALIFASYVPTKNKMYIIHEMFDVYRQYFSDCDIYVGINGNLCPEYIEYLESLKDDLNIIYSITPTELETPSDVSAYQTALKLLHDSGKTYEYIWFGHTKGMVNNSSEWRIDFLNNFFKKRKEITNLLETCDAGTYSLYLAKYAGTIKFKDVLQQYYKFKKPYFYTYLYLYTFYVIKGKYIHNFLNNCDPSFYNTNLISNGADIYMFERDIPHIAWRQGGYPIYKQWEPGVLFGGSYPEFHYFQDVKKYYD